MNIKKITSLSMLLSMMIMTFTGVILFITPPGRVANWANWEIFGLSKEQYGSIHSTFMVIFIIATLFHIYYNWKPMISYMKNKSKELIIFTKEMVVAFALTLIVLLGTIYETSPFSNFLNFGEEIKESWEKDYGTAPYSHAELSSLKSFSKKLNFDIKKVESILKSNNISYTFEKSLSQIAKENKTSPQYIYNLLKKEFEKDGEKLVQLTGLGKKKIKSVALALGLETDEFIKKLKALGIKEVDADDKFRNTLEKYNLSPMDVIEKLGYKK